METTRLVRPLLALAIMEETYLGGTARLDLFPSP